MIVIEPGSVRTDIWAREERRAKELEDQLLPDQRARYRPLFEALRRSSARDAARGIPATEVATVIVTAVQDPSPRTRYLVGRKARLLGRIALILPDRLLDRGINRAMHS